MSNIFKVDANNINRLEWEEPLSDDRFEVALRLGI